MSRRNRRLRFSLRATLVVVFLVALSVWWWISAPSRMVHRFADALIRTKERDTLENIRVVPYGDRTLKDVWLQRQMFLVKYVANGRLECTLHFIAGPNDLLQIGGGMGPVKGHSIGDSMIARFQNQFRHDRALRSIGVEPPKRRTPWSGSIQYTANQQKLRQMLDDRVRESAP